jgi:hypothetical protein
MPYNALVFIACAGLRIAACCLTLLLSVCWSVCLSIHRMLVAMFRLVELLEKQQNQPASARKVPTGRILIDGVDIATVGLHTLRQRITIIPQVRNVSVCPRESTLDGLQYIYRWSLQSCPPVRPRASYAMPCCACVLLSAGPHAVLRLAAVQSRPVQRGAGERAVENSGHDWPR